MRLRNTAVLHCERGDPPRTPREAYDANLRRQGLFGGRVRFKERFVCRAIGHLYVRCLDTASNSGATAIFPVESVQ